MAKKIVSPGVFTNEIDQSFLPAAIADIGAVVIGPTAKGPALIPTTVTSYSDFQRKFGDTFKSGSSYYQYLTSHTAEQYLKHSDKLTVVRILAGSYSGATATISSSIDPAIVGTGIGGVKAYGEIKFNNSTAIASSSATISQLTASMINENGTKIDFVFTGSVGLSNHSTAQSSTLIYVNTGSVTHTSPSSSADPNIAQSWAEVINNSSSLHGIPISASAYLVGTAQHDIYGVLQITSSKIGNHAGESVIGGSRILGTSTNLSASLLFTTASFMSASGHAGSNFSGTQRGALANETTLHLNNGQNPSFKTPFKLHTLADGKIMNSTGPIDSNSLLKSGSKDNLRYEISTFNKSKGSFTLTIRSGDDIEDRKQILETFTNVDLDPNSKNYIAKSIGDQYNSIKTDENSNPFLQLVGDYPNKSKYVRVEVIEKTINYIDENGDIRVAETSASLPMFHSGSNSGSFGGSFSGGTDGTVQHPIGAFTYENISENNSQGLDPSNNGGASGYNEYVQALDLLSNQDEYDVNLILTPGIIDSVHTAISKKIMDVCQDRGDCFALIDPVEYNKNVGDVTERAGARDTSYAAMYWPWVKIPDNQLGVQRWVPPSVAVAGVYAFNDKVTHAWFAPAGLNRGTINVAKQAERRLTQADRDTLYDSNVNPIATFPGQGVTVFGQKTLQKKASALDRVNVRRLLIKVKKFIASSSRFLVFEQNNAVTRRRFLGIVNPFLEQVQSQSGLSAFRVVMDETNNTPDQIDRNQLVGQLFLQPTRTAEFVVLDFTIQPTGASFTS